ncbi:MAG TPA: hypothetical protein VIN59_08775, partial [Alphaproteobacteria bacterium]
MKPLLYRVFCLTLTVFFALFAASAAQAQGDTLLVKGVGVDISADSALSARNKAFAEARRKAYEQLAAQYVSADQIANLSVPDDQVLASMVRDFEIVNEKMTSKRYVGTFDVRFNPAVRGSFQTHDATVTAIGSVANDQIVTTTTTPGTVSTRSEIITGSDTATEDNYIYSPARGNVIASPVSAPAMVPQTQAVRPTLVLPWYGPRGRQTLWGAENPWRAAWEANDKLARDKSMPIMLPVGDADDMRDYAPVQALSSQGNIEGLIKKYDAADAVLAIAEPAEGGALIVSLYRFEGGSPVAMGRFGVDGGSGAESLKQAVDRAVVSMRAMPSGGSSVVPASVAAVNVTTPYSSQPIPTTPNAMYFVTIARFSGLQQWVMMRNALASTPGIQAVDVQSISPSQAQLQFAYSGDGGSLSALLAQRGLQISPISGGTAVAGLNT